ncbi:hypothetical protein QJS10_CPB18g01899 [Acorus calamus]|uniref:RRM domain-containing protein n=1 Tax=Acorus calamus TaxID=4465 RepID=A0AAV9CNC8_ACOCL|nr:hypothetical protein QJS10_CPB18g01899 [Acorus calamus]
MAAAAAVVCPCFSSASTTTTTTTNARLPQYEAAPRMLTRTRLPRTRATAIGLSVWSPRSPKISVAVAQEEAAAAEVEVEEVEEGTVAEGGEEEEEEEKQWKLYFGNLPYHCGSAQLAGIIQEFGSPEMVEVLYDRETGRSRGFAFVTMSSMEDAEAVIQNLDGREFGGRTLRVNFSDKPRPKEPLYPETEFKLFVGNLSWTVTSEILAQGVPGVRQHCRCSCPLRW